MSAVATLDRSPDGVALQEREYRVRSLKPGWSIVAAGASVPIGMSVAAAFTSSLNTASDRVALAAWVVVGVVGTASVISAAAVLRGHRIPRTREKRVEKTGNGRTRETAVRQ